MPYAAHSHSKTCEQTYAMCVQNRKHDEEIAKNPMTSHEIYNGIFILLALVIGPLAAFVLIIWVFSLFD